MRLKPLGEDGQGLSPPWPVKLVLCMAPFIVWKDLAELSASSPLLSLDAPHLSLPLSLPASLSHYLLFV